MKPLSESKLIICGLVRNCAKNLERNLETMLKLCKLAKDYHFIIFENDSTDNSKQILKKYATSPHFSISCNDFGTSTFPENTGAIHPGYSKYRITKMASYRNSCLDILEKEKISGDYVIVLDWDLKKIKLRGIIESFSLDCEWDVIFANGISNFPVIPVKRYFDTYALVELGKEKIPQTMQSIFENQRRFAFLKAGMPLFPVASAFGGLAIHRKVAMEECRYGIFPNENEQVECRSEHFYFYREIHKRGFDRFFINPSIKICYPNILYDVTKRYGIKFVLTFAVNTIHRHCKLFINKLY
ncbi:MAG: glycosyltransferase family 2 protein [Dysgonamonadaceae bacterium]|jgi:hypothetical protein|nr:glycosyltransferase family 2 protein [Dysgonamonadaceae bacterium]